MMMKRNLLAGLTSSTWSAVVNLAAVPFYLNYLGIEAYGLIGFFVTTQALLQLLDMGMAPTINREVARCSALGDLPEAAKLLHTLAVIYWYMAGVIALVFLSLSPWIAEYWLQSKQLSQQTIEHSMMLMGLVVACRWPIGLYQGALIGAQRITVLSGINMIMVTLSTFGAVFILAFVSSTIEAFFIWQACVGLIYAIIMRFAAWRIIGRVNKIRFDLDKLKSVWRFTAGMSGIALTGLVFTQLDKVILSKMLVLEEFGQYMLATAVVSGLYVLINPVFNVIYPKMSALVVTDNTEKLTELYRLGARMLVTMLFPVAMLLAVFPGELVGIWTGNSSLASNVGPVISLLAIGTALHGVMYFPYALQLSYGMTRLPLIINIILMTISIPLLIFLALKYGAVGGAMAWLILHVSYVLLGTCLTHRHLLKGVGTKWLLQDIGIPLMLFILAGLVGYYAIQKLESPAYIKLIVGSVLALLISVISILTSTQFRSAILNSLIWKNRISVL